MLNIALPKGRLGDKVYDMLAAAGYECPGYYEQNRKLVFESPEKNVRYLLVKPSDVAIYVESRCRCRHRWKGHTAGERIGCVRAAGSQHR